MPLKTILFAAAAFLLLAATNPKTGKIKTIYSSRYGDTLTYKYDASGRISEVASDRGYLSTYIYKANIIIEKIKGGSTVTMFLNSRGFVDSLVDIDSSRITTLIPDPNGPPGVTRRLGIKRIFPYAGDHLLSLGDIGINPQSIVGVSKKFIYDDQGYLTQERSYLAGKLEVTADHVIENGNIASYIIKYFFADTVVAVNPVTNEKDIKIVKNDNMFCKLKYVPGKTNSLATSALFGKASKGLASQMVEYDAERALQISDSTVTTFRYTFDDRQRVSSLIKTVSSTPGPWNSDAQEADTCHFRYY
ncbi:MAG: hypothetical protein JWO03_3169 [Bacteroidetes bacterium]|nr:hypothetical protein [Bacteroidota bacterium]